MKIRSTAPLRIGFGGGGTDLDSYCNKFGGYVLNATISLKSHCLIQPTNDQKIIFESPDYLEFSSQKMSKKLILNGEMNLHKGVYNRIVKEFKLEPLSFKMTTYSDAPPGGSGLGGSSTLIVSMIKCFSEWLNLPLGDYDIAKLAYDIERKDVGIAGGAQDQYAATFGGFNFMEFYKNENVIVNPLRVKDEILSELESSTVLYFTNITRKASQIESEKKLLISNNKSIKAMHKVKEDATLMKNSILKGDIKSFAESLHDSWIAKKSVSKSVSNKEIDNVYKIAQENGAIAGKVSGAGGGGFMFFIVPPEKRYQLIQHLNDKKGKVFNFHFVNHGAKSWTIS
tara:strand:+ start:713 stop:1735 length:1023 start_codon:yes stop_codon:yes gene_type:complete